MSVRVFLVDDHRLFLDGLRSLLDGQPDIEVVGIAENGREAVRLSAELCPDVVVMDVSMPHLNGIDATMQILTRCPDAKVVALSMYSDKPFVAGMLKAGAVAYLRKDCAHMELLSAISAVRKGETYLSPTIAGTVIEGYVGDSRQQPEAVWSALSSREREVLQLMAEGKGTRDIAVLLQVGEKTVETYRRRLMAKLGISNLADLIKYAIREGLTTLET